MLWYLLAPIRRSVDAFSLADTLAFYRTTAKTLHLAKSHSTTEPYVLPPNHPLRVAFVRVGEQITRQSARFILFSLAVSIAISYPLLSQLSNHAAELYRHVPALQSHAWTSVQLYAGVDVKVPDLVVRQVWFEGDFMGAIRDPVLQEASVVQNTVLGLTSQCDENVFLDLHGLPASLSAHDDSRSSAPLKSKAFFHSPMSYWGCSLNRLQHDPDKLRTINERSRERSPANLTLKPSTVFAGKSFDSGKLVAADALVLSLFYEPNPQIDDDWSHRYHTLSEIDGWNMYVLDRNDTSRIYEIRYQPLNTLDYALLALCYGFMLAYLLTNLNGLRILRSRLGLVTIVIIQMILSTVAAFSILLFMNIRVSQIPLEAYPFVVLVMGVQNSLLRAVIKSPPERTASDRIAESLGSVGYLSVLDTAQNLLILRCLYVILNPGLSVFCAFAGLCVVLDLLYHFLFFVPSLCISLRSTDLAEMHDHDLLIREDMDDRFSAENPNQGTPHEVLARLPFGFPSPGRLLGTGLIFGFVLLLNQHFTDGSCLFPLTRQSSGGSGMEERPDTSSLLPQARRTSSWLELQDQETARDLIDIINPGVHTLLVRVYDPVILTRKGADRLHTSEIWPRQGNWNNRFSTVSLISLPLIVVALGLRYFDFGTSNPEAHLQDTMSASLTIKCPAGGHGLDILSLTASPQGMVVSIGLDHKVRLWNLKRMSEQCVSEELPLTCNNETLWPVLAVAVNGVDKLVAILTASGTLYVWDVEHHRFTSTLSLKTLVNRRPCSFFFARRATQQPHSAIALLMVGSDGALTEILPEKQALVQHKICSGPVTSSEPVLSSRLPLRIVSIVAEGHTFVTSKHGNTWTTENVEFRSHPSKLIGIINGFWPLPSLGLMGIALGVQSDEVFLVDLQSHAAIRRFDTGWIKPSTLRAIYPPRRSCPRCGTTSVESFSVVYVEEATGDLRMHTFIADEARRDLNPWICFRAERDPRDRHCAGFERTDESHYRIGDPGAWEATGSNRIAGMRTSKDERRRYTQLTSQSTPNKKAGLSTGRSYSDDDNMQIRMRGSRFKTQMGGDALDPFWEAWTMDASGKVDTTPVAPSTIEPSLFVPKIAAMVLVGRNLLVTAFGVSIKLLMLGPERFDEDEDDARPRRSFDHHGRGSTHRTKARLGPAVDRTDSVAT